MALALLVLAIALALVLVMAPDPATGGKKGLTKFRFNEPRHLHDSKAVRLAGQGFFMGRARFIDVFAARSKRTFVSGGARKRVYRLSSQLSIRMKEDYKLLSVECRQKSPRGTFMAVRGNGRRAFFPREATHIEPVTGSGQVGLNLGPLSVSVPFPGITYYRSSSIGPNIAWPATLASRKHAWTWGWDDGHPEGSEGLSFLGYWGGPKKGIEFTVKCHVTTYQVVGSDVHLQGGDVRLKRTFP